MTHTHFLIRENPAGPRLRWMVLLSLAAHSLVLGLLMGSPPDADRSVFFSPTYTVSLVGMPAGEPGDGNAPGDAAGGAQRRTTGTDSTPGPLWHGPQEIASQVKTIGRRTHTLTISKKTAPDGKSTAAHLPAAGAEAAGRGSGGTPGGTAAGPADLRFSRYYEAVWQQIKAAWVLPQLDGRGKRAAAVALITISRDGRITAMSFEKKSGNTALDRSVERALKKADPLPPLPPGLGGQYLELGIRFMPDAHTGHEP